MPVTRVLLRYAGAWLLLAVGTLFSTVTFAGQGVWTSGGPNEAGFYFALGLDRTTPGTVYAGGPGVFKSVDFGKTWVAATVLRDVGGAGAGSFFDLVVDPSTPSRIFGATDGGVFMSVDSGTTWSASNRGLTSLNVRALAVDPTIPTTIYAGTVRGEIFTTLGGGVFKSVDSGATWNATGLTGIDVFSLAVDPATPSTLYAATGVQPYGIGAALKSTDGGTTWKMVGAGLPSGYINCIAIAPTTPSTLYAGTSGSGVFRSTDAGGSWSIANAGLTILDVSSLAIDGRTPATLYAGTGNGVFKSINSGATWTAVTAGLPSSPVRALAFDPSGATTLYAALDLDGVWQSTPPPDGVSSFRSFVPIVLDVVGFAHYSSEIQLTNLGTEPVEVRLLYTSSMGAGSGEVTETVPAGRQVIHPDVISYLRSRGLRIPASGNQAGTLLLSAASPALRATVRTGSETSSPQPVGWAGLSYSDTEPANSGLSMKVVYGLRAGEASRSNLAVYNMGAEPVSLTVSLLSGDDPRDVIATPFYSLDLPAYGWHQFTDVLRGSAVSSAFAFVQRVGGTGPFGAYGVVNDRMTNDGSFIPAIFDWLSEDKVTIPVLVEAGAFESELILFNRSFQFPATLTLRYVESLSPGQGSGGSVTVDVPVSQQRVIPNAIDFLRSKGVNIGSRGKANYAGSLQVVGTGFLFQKVFVGARTSAKSAAGGEYGVFYPAIGASQEFSEHAYVLGLRADADNRSNVAVLHTGTEGSGPITLELQVLDGSKAGVPVGGPLSVNLDPGQWAQPAKFFASRNVPNGYVRIRRTAGTAHWYAYGVINDGGQPGQRTGDGAYVPGVRP